MDRKNPLVSIVIVNHNGKHHLKTCMDSLLRIEKPSFEVIIVDNQSTDKSVDYIKRNFKWVKLVENDNIIYPAGNNMGVKNSKGKYIVFLNNDTEVEPNFLKELVRAIESRPEVAACACKVKLFFDRSLINSAGMGMDRYGFAFSRGLICRGKFEKDVGQYDKSVEVFATYSAAMLMRKDVFEKVGGFNADFGFHYEEIDLSWRVRLLGYKILYVPSAVVYHKTGGTKTEYTERSKFYIEKNRLRTMLQNYGLVMLFGSIPIYLLLKLLEFSLYLVVLKADVAKAIGLAILDNIKRLPRILEDRARVQKMRRVGDEAIRKYLAGGAIELSMFLGGYGKFVLG